MKSSGVRADVLDVPRDARRAVKNFLRFQRQKWPDWGSWASNYLSHLPAQAPISLQPPVVLYLSFTPTIFLHSVLNMADDFVDATRAFLSWFASNQPFLSPKIELADLRNQGKGRAVGEPHMISNLI